MGSAVVIMSRDSSATHPVLTTALPLRPAPPRSESIQLTLAPTSIGKPAAKAEAPAAAHLTAFRAALIYTWYGNLFLVAVCFFFFLAAQTTRQISDFW